MAQKATRIQQKVWEAIKNQLYWQNGYLWLNFHGTRADYKKPMVFRNVTPSGNVKVSDPMSFVPSGPGNFRNRMAMLRKRPFSEEYHLWVEDGTGSVSIDLGYLR